MPRNKRKRVDVETPTTRRRRSGAGNEPKEANTVEGNNDEMSSAPKDDKGNQKQSTVEKEECGTSPNANTTNAIKRDEGNDHATAESNEPKGPLTTSTPEAIVSSSSAAPGNGYMESDSRKQTRSAATPATGESTPKIVRIRSLLEHRKLLLKHVGQGKRAAKRRIGEHNNNKAVAIQTDEQELASFLEMTRAATSLARKQSRVDVSGDASDRRTSVSLRRGSTVGARMNAALSSLAPGQSGPAPAPAPISSTLQPTTSSLQAKDKMAGILAPPPAMSQSVSIPKRPNSATGRGTGRKVQGGTLSGRGVTHPKILQQQHQRALASSAVGGGLTLKGMSGRRVVPQAQLVQYRPTRVVCPEHITLRERRDKIRNQLSSLLQTRMKRNVSATEMPMSPVDRRRSSFSTSSSPQSLIRGTPQPSKGTLSATRTATSSNTWKDPGSAPLLPKRRNTHWDTVLEEMRWLATDFREERKWKQSTARFLVNEAANTCSTDRASKQSPAAAVLSPSIPGNTRKLTSTLSETCVEFSVDSDKQKIFGTDEDQGKSVAMIDADTEHFHQATPEDNDASIQVARKICAMLSNFATCMHSDLLFLKRMHLSSDCRHRDQFSRASEKVDTNSAAVVVVEDEKASDALMKGPHASLPSKSHDNAAALTKTSHRIDKLIQSMKETASVSNKNYQTGKLYKTHGINNLVPHQLAAVAKIEDRWQRLQVGVLLVAPISSGKTIATCSLLWRNRLNGAQLIVCSADRLIRWIHELGNFPTLKVRILHTGSASIQRNNDIFVESDVIVCPFSSFTNLTDAQIAQMNSIVVDCRYSSSFSGSLSLVSGIDPDRTNDTNPPAELRSKQWWETITLATRGKPNRLIIEKNAGIPEFVTSLTKKRLLQIVSLRTAFLYGAEKFESPIYTIDKSVLAYSRFRMKKNVSTSLKFTQVRDFTLTLSEHCVCSMGSTSQQGNEFLAIDDSLWELQFCRMTPSQRTSYDEACDQACSTLARGFKSEAHPYEDSYRSCAASLINIRSLCTHSCRDTERFLESNISQPNSSIAHTILKESGKFQHLISLLISELGCDVVADQSCLALLPIAHNATHKTEKQKNRPVKVVIVAALFEVRMLISTLLHSLGVAHSVLSGGKRSSSESTTESSTLSWSCDQLFLSKFNSDSSSNHTAANVLISSALSVAGDHGGIGVERAETVILVDEDWSGREELVLLSLVARSQFYRNVTGKDSCRVVRLVSEDSCEQALLLAEKHSSNSKGSKPFANLIVTANGQLDMSNCIHFGNGNANAIHPNIPKLSKLFSFPAYQLLNSRNKSLTDVLKNTAALPQLLSASHALLFLPLLDDDAGKTEPQFLRKLIDEEKLYHNERLAQSHSFHSQLPPTPSVFFNFLVQQIDLPSIPSRHFLHKMRRKDDLIDGDASIDFVLRLPVASETVKNKSSADDMSVASGSGTGDTALTSTSEIVESVLFYKQTDRSTNKKKPPGISVSFKRTNLYSSLYSSLDNSFGVHDGKQSSEALTYFPPIFPRMHECCLLAGGDVEAIHARAKKNTDTAIVTDSVEKRKSDFQDPISPTKRSRPITEDEASLSDAASVLNDLTDDYGLAGIGAVPLPRDSALSSSIIPSKPLLASRTGRNDWLTSTQYCDIEEHSAAGQCDSRMADDHDMILVVSRKRQRGLVAPLLSSQLNRGSGSGQTMLISSGAGTAVVYSDSNKATKKEHSSAFTTPTLDMSSKIDATRQHISRTSDTHRYRLLSSLRQSGEGSTLVEAPMFRVATNRVQKKISKRLVIHGWSAGVSFDTGPGLPLLVSKQSSTTPSSIRRMFEVDSNTWTSIVKRLKNASSFTGSESVELSLAQRATLRRSLVAPCRVDFGPFNCGYLALTSGMTTAAPPRPRTGVSLPMGVKITQLTKEQIPLVWNNTDDEKLESAAIRFGMNWILAARVLSGFEDIVISSQIDSESFLYHRAARSCRDRWQQLARTNPAMVIKARQSDRFTARPDKVPIGEDDSHVSTQREKSDDGRRDKLEFISSASIELPSQNKQAAQSPTGKSSGTLERPQRPYHRTYSALKTARAKFHIIPKSIPGVTGSVPVVGPSHHSHDEAVQSSPPVAWKTGRTDMWPLQLLDAADKQRQAAILPVPSSADRNATSYPPRTHVKSSGAAAVARTNNSSHSSRRVVPQPVIPPSQRVSSAGKAIASHPTNVSTNRGAAPPLPVATKESFAPPPPPAGSASSAKVHSAANPASKPPALAKQSTAPKKVQVTVPTLAAPSRVSVHAASPPRATLPLKTPIAIADRKAVQLQPLKTALVASKPSDTPVPLTPKDPTSTPAKAEGPESLKTSQDPTPKVVAAQLGLSGQAQPQT